MFGATLFHPSSPESDEGVDNVTARDSARISRTLCHTNQPIKPSTPRMIGMSNGRVTDLMSS
jgi:hypothetical protein